MDSLKIIIATGLIILAGSLIVGCTALQNPADPQSQDLKEAARFIPDVELELSATRDKNQLTIKVNLNNPSRKPLTSVQSWLTFDPQALKGLGVNTSGSPFTLTAPFENAFDQQKGLVRLGRGNDKPISDAFITVAELQFKVLKEGTTMIDAYDYKPNLRGHSSANVLSEGKPFNVLKKPFSPALIIQ